MTTLLLCGIGWLAGWLVGWSRRMPLDAASPSTEAPARISVVVPARNEANRIGPLLAGLSQPQGNIELVVVDDGSTDETAAIAAAAGGRVLRVERPAGWTGKAWACWSGALATNGDVLVFLDADTVPTSSAIRSLASRATETGGLVSLQPRHRAVRWHEQLSALPNLVAVMGAGTGPVRRGSRWRGPAAFGMAMAIPRGAYMTAGGHSVRPAAVIDDLALATTVHDAGLSVETWCGGADVSVRMYGEGLGQLVRGWVKNFSAGARSIPILRTAAVSIWVAALVGACITLMSAAVSGHVGIMPILVYAAFAVQTSILATRVGTFGRATLLALPVQVVTFVGLFVASAAGTLLRRSVSWRGRSIEVGAVR